MKMKQESARKLKKKSEIISKQQELITQSQSRVDQFEAQTKKNEDQLAFYNEHILNLTKQLEEPQRKKTTFENPSLASFKEQMDQETIIGLHYVDFVYLLEEEIQK